MFNCIDDIDIGGYYTFLSSIMAHSLEKILQLGSNDNVDIPRGILEGAIELLDIAVMQINLGKEAPMNLRHYATYSLVRDAYAASKSREENKDKLHTDIKEMSMFVRTLEHPVVITNNTRKVYSRLHELFKKIYEISDSNSYVKRLYGAKSKYTFPLGY